MIKLFRKKKKGFTPIELIVVIAILGILASIAIPKFKNTAANAEEQAKEATIRTVNSAYQIYLAAGNSAETWPENYVNGAKKAESGNNIVIDVKGGTPLTLKLYDGSDNLWVEN